MDDETLGLPVAPAHQPSAPPVDRIAHYRLEQKLGEGGMGVVYSAMDERLDRRVAIKLVRQDKLDPQSRKWLWREARMAAAINHPGICQLYDIGETGEQLYLAMEYLEGELVSDIIKSGPQPVDRSVTLILELLAGLAYMHQRGLIHRDLKPANLMKTAHGLKILDFGLALRLDAAANDQSQILGTVGTPAYMSPETINNEPVDARADLFAVGAILYELISGRKAFQGGTMLAILQAVLQQNPPALGGSAAAAQVDRVIRHAIAKRPADRTVSAEELADALRAAMAGVRDGAAPAPARAMIRLIVLPFRVLRRDEETGFLGVSLPEAITTTMAGLGSIVVRSSSVAARFASDAPDLDKLATEAGADIALTGTLMRAGNQVRVNTQLIEVPGGTLVKAHTSQAALTDIFDLQDQLVQGIVESLRLQLSPGETRDLRAAAPASGSAYELFLRGNATGSGINRLIEARDLYLDCLRLDETYAPAWARLGRCYRLLAKYNEDPQTNLRLAESTFERALALQPELDLTHSQYAQLEADLGRSRSAMQRLLERSHYRPLSTDLHAGLVYACRFCGLPEESIWFYEEARRLDPLFPTSVTHTYFQSGDYRRSLDTVSGDHGYIDALSLEAMGDHAGALRCTTERLAADQLSASKLAPLAAGYVSSLRAVLEGRNADSIAIMRKADHFFLGPEESMYVARQFIRAGEVEEGAQRVLATVEQGWGNVRWLLEDRWFDPARATIAFQTAVAKAHATRDLAARTFSEGR